MDIVDIRLLRDIRNGNPIEDVENPPPPSDLDMALTALEMIDLWEILAELEYQALDSAHAGIERQRP